MPRRRKPPFPGLLAFDAVLRHGGFTEAGKALHLTQSAVSHRVAGLERHYGARLLERLNPGLRPTLAGKRLAAALTPLLAAIDALDREMVAGAPARLRLALGQSLLRGWLSARLQALSAAFPGLDIEIVALTHPGQFARVRADLELHWTPRAEFAGGPHALAFPEETVFPVCAPGLRRMAKNWRDLPLIGKSEAAEEDATPEWRWQAWLGGAARRARLRFDDPGSALQAAIDGSGVALTRSLLAGDALAAKRLVRVRSKPAELPCGKIQTARWKPDADALARPVAQWLVAKAATPSRG